jgi:hypothetical protein
MPETYKSYGTKLTTANETIVYSAGNTTAIVNSIHVANYDASNSSAVTLRLWKDTTNTDSYYICKTVAVPIQSTYQALDTPIPLESGDTLRATAANANRLDVIVSVLEIT